LITTRLQHPASCKQRQEELESGSRRLDHSIDSLTSIEGLGFRLQLLRTFRTVEPTPRVPGRGNREQLLNRIWEATACGEPSCHSVHVEVHVHDHARKVTSSPSCSGYKLLSPSKFAAFPYKYFYLMFRHRQTPHSTWSPTC
jgi:hypothetical protein